MMKLEVHISHLVAHDAAGGMKVSQAANRRDCQIAERAERSSRNGVPIRAILFTCNLVRFCLGRTRKMDDAVPAVQVCFDDRVNDHRMSYRNGTTGGIKREHCQKVKTGSPGVVS